MNITLSTVNLEVSNVARSKAFYISLFGLTENNDRSHEPSFAYLQSATCAITLTTPPARNPIEPSRSIELGFETDELPGFMRRLQELGVGDFNSQTMGWGAGVELKDPDGHRVIVYAFHRD